MTKTDSYFQFPIAALQMDCNPRDIDPEAFSDRLQDVLRYCLFSVAVEADPADECVFNAAESEVYNQPVMEDIEADWDCQLAYAASVLNVRLGDPKQSLYRSAFNEIDQLIGGEMQVRVRSDIFWDFASMRNLRPVEFCVLAAVYASIGRNAMKIVYRKQLRAIASGYSSASLIAHHGNPNHQLTTGQLRYWLDKLEGRGLFTRFPQSRRRTWYSNRMSADELLDAVAKRKIEQEAAGRVSKIDLVNRRVQELTENKHGELIA